MQPEELIRAAAKVIEASGWSQGAAARGHDGAQVPLFTGGAEQRSRVNPAAVLFSIYGALVKAMADAGGTIANPGLMWDALYRMAIVATGAPEGGANYVHPVIQYNETEGRTKEDVLAFLAAVADRVETGSVIDPVIERTDPAKLETVVH